MQTNLSQLGRQLIRDIGGLLQDYAPSMQHAMTIVVSVSQATARWIQVILISLFWLSFEGYTRAWNFLRPLLEDLLGSQLKNGHRALFCIIISVLAGNLLLLGFLPFNLWAFLTWIIHGLMIHAFWERGLRWCRWRLGIRSIRYDPEKPYDNLDLGN